MKAEHWRPSFDEIGQLIESNRRLAEIGLSIDHPENLIEALVAVQTRLQKVGEVDSVYESLPGIAYFLGEEIAGLQWRRYQRRVPVCPFAGFEELGIKYPSKGNVVLIGCWGGQLLTAERRFLASVGMENVTNTVIDVSALSVERLKVLKRTDESVIMADARLYPIGDLRPDLILTDLLIDAPTEKSRALLANLVNSLSGEACLLTRFCIIPEKVRASYFRLMDVAGEFWSSTVEEIFGYDTQTGRDNYYGLRRDQWRELGLLFSSFIKTNFYGEGRFKDEQEVFDFLTENNVVVEKSVSLKSTIGRPGDEITVLALVLR